MYSRNFFAISALAFHGEIRGAIRFGATVAQRRDSVSTASEAQQAAKSIASKAAQNAFLRGLSSDNLQYAFAHESKIKADEKLAEAKLKEWAFRAHSWMLEDPAKRLAVEVKDERVT